MKGIYLAAYKARHPNYDIVYQDINPRCKCDLQGDMLEVDLKDYDFIIATPPCNFWTRANYRRYRSEYALKTLHLLPLIILKCIASKKPFIVENVRNDRLFNEFRLYKFNCFIYKIGRHTYWTNVSFDTNIEQVQDFRYGGYYIRDEAAFKQGGDNVSRVIERFLEEIHR